MKFVFFALSLASVCVAQTADQQFATAVRLQQTGALEEACRAYERLLAKTPDRIDALSNLGLVYGELGRMTEAIASFQKAVRLSPDQVGIRLNLAMVYLQAGQFEHSELEAKKVKVLEPSNLLSDYILGLTLLKGGRLQEGIAELELVNKRQPGDVRTATTLVSAYLKTQQFEKAKSIVDASLAHSETAEAHLMTGTFYLVTGDTRDAVPELQRAQTLDPRLDQLGSTLAEAYALTGNSDAAMKMFQSQVEKRPTDFEANAFLGWLYLEQQNLETAGDYLGRALSLRPGDPGVKFQLARLARAENDNPRAAILLESVIAQQPENAPAHVLLAQTYFKLKRTDDGKKESEIAKRLNEQQQHQFNAF